MVQRLSAGLGADSPLGQDCRRYNHSRAGPMRILCHRRRSEARGGTGGIVDGEDLNEGWVRWTGALATLGFAVTILDNYWAIVTTSAGAAQFIDTQGWLGYGVWPPGYWGVSLLALRGRVWPTGLGSWASLGRLCISWCSPR